MNQENPLVSVFIVTYNSQDYIIEALDSVKSQTYQNIELVVSDDCSNDNTIAKVKEWISQNNGRFVRTEIVKSPVNTGIPANYNRAVKACKGEWLKMMDGDDLILPNCVEDNVKFIKEKPEAEVVFSDMFIFKDDKERKIIRKKFKERDKSFFRVTIPEQSRWLLGHNVLPSQTCFIKANLLKQNPYEEKYRLLEDYPMWIKLSQKGIAFFYFDKCTAMYRIVDSVSSNNKELFSSTYIVYSRQFNKDVVTPLIIKYKYSKEYDDNRKYYLLYDVCNAVLGNRRNAFTYVVYLFFRAVIFYGLHFKIPLDKQKSTVY